MPLTLSVCNIQASTNVGSGKRWRGWLWQCATKGKVALRPWVWLSI